MSPEAAKRALGRLATDPPDRARTVIEEATAATDDVADAAAFAEDVGLARLERAVENATESDPALARRGSRALAAFRRFRRVATASRRE